MTEDEVVCREWEMGGLLHDLRLRAGMKLRESAQPVGRSGTRLKKLECVLRCPLERSARLRSSRHHARLADIVETLPGIGWIWGIGLTGGGACR